MVVPTSHRTRYCTASYVTTDAYTHGQSLSGGWRHTYEQLERGRFLGEMQEAWLGPMQLIYEKLSGPVKYEGRPWQGARVFFSSFGGRGGGMHWDTRSVDDDLLTTFRWNATERITCNHASESVLVLIEDDFLSSLAEQAGVKAAREPRERTFKHTSDRTLVRRFQSTVLHILRAVATDPSLLEADPSRCTMRDEVLDVLVCMFAGLANRDARLPPPCTRAYIVDRAIEFIDSRLADSLSIADICSAVRVCPRTLCYSFEAVLGISPRRYLLTTRLNRVRRDILMHGGSVPLQNLAARWGLSHMGRFARYYRETFGERPSETMRQATRPPWRALRDNGSLRTLDAASIA